MSGELKHKVVLESEALSDYYNTTPTHVVVVLTEDSIGRLEGVARAYWMAAGQLPKEDIRALEVAFDGFDYMVAEDDAEDPEQMRQWSGSWERAVMRVDKFGFYFRSHIRDTSVAMESCTLTFAQFEEELRKFRALQLGASIEGAMPDDGAGVSKSSGFSL